MKSVENNCYFPDLVQAFPNENGWFTKGNDSILPVRGGGVPGGVALHVPSRRAVMLLLSSSGFASSLYAMLQELRVAQD